MWSFDFWMCSEKPLLRMKFKFFLKCRWRSERAYGLKSFSSVLAKSVLNLILVEEKGHMHHMHDKSTRQHQILQYKFVGSTPHSVTRHSHEGLFSSGFLPDPKKCDVTPTSFRCFDLHPGVFHLTMSIFHLIWSTVRKLFDKNRVPPIGVATSRHVVSVHDLLSSSKTCCIEWWNVVNSFWGCSIPTRDKQAPKVYPPWKLTYPLKNDPWKRRFLLETIISIGAMLVSWSVCFFFSEGGRT